MKLHSPANAAARACGLIAALACTAASPAAASEMTLRRLFVAEHFMTPAPRPGRGVSRSQFTFVLVRDGPVRLLVVDPRGRRVKTLIDGIRSTGPHEVWWNGKRDNGTPVPAGLYYAIFAVPLEDVREVHRIPRLDNDSPELRPFIRGR